VPDLLDQIRAGVHARLRELRPLVEEHRRLEMALRALAGVEGGATGPVAAAGAGATRAGGRRQTRPATAAKGRPRAPRGANRQAVLEAVRERPGATAAELAGVSGVERNALYGVLRRLVAEGELQTRNLPTGRTGYALGASRPAEPAEASEAAPPAPVAETPLGATPESGTESGSAAALPESIESAAEAPTNDESSKATDGGPWP
jgi:hypothetical protein